MIFLGSGADVYTSSGGCGLQPMIAMDWIHLILVLLLDLGILKLIINLSLGL